MQLDSQGLQAQKAAETARQEAGKLGMKILQQQMQVREQQCMCCTPPSMDLAFAGGCDRVC